MAEVSLGKLQSDECHGTISRRAIIWAHVDPGVSSVTWNSDGVIDVDLIGFCFALILLMEYFTSFTQ